MNERPPLITRGMNVKMPEENIDQAAAVAAVLRMIGYKGDKKFKSVAEVYKSRSELSIMQVIKLDNIRWLSCNYGGKAGGV